MKIDVLGLQAFVAIADHRSFHNAADALHVTQTALSRRLQNLESFLGVKLVERTTREVSLTGVGSGFLPEARRLIGDLTAALTEIRETGRTRRGDVVIACVPTAGVQFLPEVIGHYAARHPDNRIAILDHASSRVAEAVRRREAELGIAVSDPAHADLAAITLFTDSFVLACRDDHPLARRKAVPWRALEPFPLIVAGAESSNRAPLELALAQGNIVLRAFYEVQRSSTAVGLVAAGVAAAVVPRLALQRGAYPRLREVRLTHPVVTRDLVLVTRRSAVLSPAAQALHEAVLRIARQREGALTPQGGRRASRARRTSA